MERFPVRDILVHYIPLHCWCWTQDEEIMIGDALIDRNCHNQTNSFTSNIECLVIWHDDDQPQ